MQPFGKTLFYVSGNASISFVEKADFLRRSDWSVVSPSSFNLTLIEKRRSFKSVHSSAGNVCKWCYGRFRIKKINGAGELFHKRGSRGVGKRTAVRIFQSQPCVVRNISSTAPDSFFSDKSVVHFRKKLELLIVSALTASVASAYPC